MLCYNDGNGLPSPLEINHMMEKSDVKYPQVIGIHTDHNVGDQV